MLFLQFVLKLKVGVLGIIQLYLLRIVLLLFYQLFWLMHWGDKIKIDTIRSVGFRRPANYQQLKKPTTSTTIREDNEMEQIKTALAAFGETTETVTIRRCGIRAAVYIGGEYYGIWNFVTKTFED